MISVHQVLQDLQQLRSLCQQQVQIEQQSLNLCNRIGQTISQIQASQQIPFVGPNQSDPQFGQGALTMGSNISPTQGYNPSVLNQVMQAENQYRPTQPLQPYGGQWQ